VETIRTAAEKLRAALAASEVQAEQPAQVATDERATFEAWCTKRWGGDRGDSFLREEGGAYAGEYINGRVEFAYSAWQARAALASAPRVPQINYRKLVEDCFSRTKAAQGTRGCVQFKAGAEWFREQVLAAAPQPEGGQS
jgi:hypothetical protein